MDKTAKNGLQTSDKTPTDNNEVERRQDIAHIPAFVDFFPAFVENLF